MTEHRRSQWQPIAELDLLGGQIEKLLEISTAQHERLRIAQSSTEVRDACVMGRVVASYTSQRDDLWRFDEQLRRWLGEDLISTQRAAVAHLQDQMLRLYDVNDALLRLTDFLQRNAPAK